MIEKLHREAYSIIVIIQTKHTGNCNSIMYSIVLGENLLLFHTNLPQSYQTIDMIIVEVHSQCNLCADSVPSWCLNL